MKKIIYLASYKAKIERSGIVYNDLYEDRDLKCDMLEINLFNYDIVLASPPCNYYSRANYRRNISKYSLETKHLLPCILNKLTYCNQVKEIPFIVENVRNPNLMKDIFKNFKYKIIFYGRHTYFTNVFNLDLTGIPQCNDNITYISSGNRQGGDNVNIVFTYFIDFIRSGNYILM